MIGQLVFSELFEQILHDNFGLSSSCLLTTLSKKKIINNWKMTKESEHCHASIVNI